MKIFLNLLLTCTAALAMETNQPTATLAGSAWQVSTFAGQTPLAGHPITFEFDADGNIGGNGSCNRFGGACTIDGNTIELGPLRSTRRACEPDVMQQEHKFLALLGSVTTWEISPDHELVLRGEDGEIRATKAAPARQN